MPPAGEHIDALVCDFPAEIRERRCVVFLRGRADDSYDSRIYVLAGWLSTATKWRRFSDDFESAGLPRTLHMRTTRRPKGKRVRTLADLTLKHAMFRVDCVLHQGNYNNIVKGKIPPEIDSPYFPLFCQVVLASARLMELSRWEGKVDWIFDEQGKIGSEAVRWYYWIKQHSKPNLKQRLGRTPTFADDDELLPLKSADLFAWQIRKHLSVEQPEKIQPNEILDSFLGKYGASLHMTGPQLEVFVRGINQGMALRLEAASRFCLPDSPEDVFNEPSQVRK
jgi:hypothetical protein